MINKRVVEDNFLILADGSCRFQSFTTVPANNEGRCDVEDLHAIGTYPPPLGPSPE